MIVLDDYSAAFAAAEKRRKNSIPDALPRTDAATGRTYAGKDVPSPAGPASPYGRAYSAVPPPTELASPSGGGVAAHSAVTERAPARRDNHDVYHEIRADMDPPDAGLTHSAGKIPNAALDARRRETNRAYRTADAFLPLDPGVYIRSPERYDTYNALYDTAVKEDEKLRDMGGRAARELPLTLPKSFAAGGLNAARGIVNEAGYLAQNAAKSELDANAELWRRMGREDYARDMEKARGDLTADGLQSWADFGENFIRGTAAEAAGYGRAGRALNGVASGMGGMAPAILSNLAVPGSGLWVTAAQAAGNATEEGLAKGMTDDEATLYGAAVGGVEALTEKLSGGIPALGVGAIDDAAEAMIRGSLKSPAAQNAAIRLVKSLGEGVEEFVSEFADAYIYRQLTGSADRSWKQVNKDAWYSALIGTLTSAGLNLSADALNAMSPKRLAKTLAADTAARMAREDIAEFRQSFRTDHGGDESISHDVLAENAEPNPVMNTFHDPMREKMGPASTSHPKEISKLMKELEHTGVEFESRPGSMAYSPGLRKGQPGKLIMDPEASYSAWLHEMRHMEDDQAAGWLGMESISDKNRLILMEERAYDTEIDFARRHGYNKIVRRLERLKFERRQEILGIQRNNRQPHT